MRKIFLLVLGFGLAFACQPKNEKSPEPNTTETPSLSQTLPTPVLSIEQAIKLMGLPMGCVNQEYPNKLGQTLGGPEDLEEPHVLHPAFYGCFDWHSAVHGHWSMVRLLKEFPQLSNRDSVVNVLRKNLSQNNIAKEIAYFEGEHNKTYERTYGWGWLLKLSEELHTWDDPLGVELRQNLSPLADLIAGKLLDYLPKLQYPVRVGTHTNTAFGLSFAWDYAIRTGHTELKEAISQSAFHFFKSDTSCPVSWEPSGADFLSPCLEEMDLMRRVLPGPEFLSWLDNFMPAIKHSGFNLEVARVGDRTDGQLVHLDGLNFSRAWVFYGLADQFPEVFPHLEALADKHLSHSFPNLLGDSYEGGHWLGTFAIYAMSQRK